MKIFLKLSVALFFVLISVTKTFPESIKHDNTKPDTIYTNSNGKGEYFTVYLNFGKENNHPTFAIWLEDMQGKFMQNLFVTEYIATGVFEYMQVNDSTWIHKRGSNYRPAALPYWNHKRIEQPKGKKIMPDESNPIPDAYTGATPQNDFILKARSDKELPDKFRIFLEINQSWDWNEYWTNNKYPENIHYKTSSQPSLVYSAAIDLSGNQREYILSPLGHGHFAGADGSLNYSLETLSTAMQIIREIKVFVGKAKAETKVRSGLEQKKPGNNK